MYRFKVTFGVRFQIKYQNKVFYILQIYVSLQHIDTDNLNMFDVQKKYLDSKF